MPRFGITGHMNLTAVTIGLVDAALRGVLTPHADDDLVGVSCLARGADSIFARVVLDLGGALEVVLPTADYREQKIKPDDAPLFDELMSRAAVVTVMPFSEAGREAYEAANETMVGSCDRLLAVWDGQAPADRGGTAAVVDYARSQGLPVTIIWPEGAHRGR